MYPFEDTRLWKTAFAMQGKQQEGQAAQLRNAFLSFRDRVAQLANEIHRDHPNFTVHDITHIDALWDTASLIAGDELTLTPTEGFVLGGAILVHDLAMGLAAYPEGIAELKIQPEWKDIITILLQKKLGRAPAVAEIDSPDSAIENEAIRMLLRINHAKQAEKLTSATWHAGGTTFHLIDNPELRETYGPSIGRIAYSHWWTADQLGKEFDPLLGAPAGYPNSWRVDRLKIAALLRLADVCQLDEGRAPSFLRALRKPAGLADLHWTFQNKLLQPTVTGDQLVYTAKSPFKADEAPAWWLCFDMLRDADREIRSTRAILTAARSDIKIQVQGIAKVESPERLANLITTDGWMPVDAHVQVTDVASLARNLGGEQLYGDDKTVPLRELIQNAVDAVRARRIVEAKDEKWGEICVRLGEDSGRPWLEVEDTGIGMSTDVLKGPFLDFGTSYWGSELMLRELPGLLSKGFVPTGRFGIGFFSVFMWGDRVQVTTQRWSNAKDNTFVLEFGSGLNTRPLLRKANNSEWLAEGGTKVRVCLKPGLLSPDGMFPAERYERAWKLDRLCEWLCPSSEVSLFVEKDGKRKRVVAASDWKTMDGYRLFKRLTRDENFARRSREWQKRLKSELKNLRAIKDKGQQLVGRACLLSAYGGDKRSPEYAVVTVGGLRASTLSSYPPTIFGIFTGTPRTATRYSAVPVVENDVLGRWASEQAQLLKAPRRGIWDDRFASVIRALGGDTGPLAVGSRGSGSVTIDQLKRWRSIPDEILVIVEDYEFRQSRKKISLNHGVVAVNSEREGMNFLRERYDSDVGRWPSWETISLNEKRLLQKNTLYFSVLEALAQAWSSTVEEVIAASDFTRKKYIVGKRGQRTFSVEADVLKNPRKKPQKRVR